MSRRMLPKPKPGLSRMSVQFSRSLRAHVIYLLNPCLICSTVFQQPNLSQKLMSGLSKKLFCAPEEEKLSFPQRKLKNSLNRLSVTAPKLWKALSNMMWKRFSDYLKDCKSLQNVLSRKLKKTTPDSCRYSHP